MRRVFTLSFWKKAIAFCFALVIVSVMLSGFQQPAQAVPLGCRFTTITYGGTLSVVYESSPGTFTEVDSLSKPKPWFLGGNISLNAAITDPDVIETTSAGQWQIVGGSFVTVSGHVATEADVSFTVYEECTGVTIVSTYAEGVWARYGEALIFLAGLITGVAIFWLLVGKVLKVLRLRRP